MLTDFLDSLPALLAKQLPFIPAMFRPMLIRAAESQLQELMNNPISILDEELEKLIDAIGARDYEEVGRIMEKFNVQPDSKIAEIVLRLMGIKETQDA